MGQLKSLMELNIVELDKKNNNKRKKRRKESYAIVNGDFSKL
jgi:hypothetical protein